MSSDAPSTVDAWESAAFSACSVGLCVLDADLRVVVANEALADVLGCADSSAALSCCQTLLGQARAGLGDSAAATLADGRERRGEITHTVARAERTLCWATRAIGAADGVVVSFLGAAPSGESIQGPPGSVKRADRLSSFENVARQLSLEVARPEIEAKIVMGMAALVDADWYAFYLADAGGNTLTFWEHQALGASAQARLETVVREAVEEFKPEGIEYDEVLMVRLEPAPCGEPVDMPLGSYLNVPVTVGNLMAGLLTVGSERRDAFAADDLTVLTALSNEASMAVARMRSCLKSVQSERMAAIGEAVATTAHYATNLTSNLTSSSHMMEVAIETRDWERVQRFWGVARRGIEAVSRLVMNMLNYSKEREPILEPTDLRLLVGSVVEQCQERAKQSGVEIGLDADRLCSEVLLDPDQIEHCLINLLINGIEAMPGGGVLSVRGEVAEEGAGEAPKILLWVSDTGSGIARADLGRIFEPFYSSKGSKGTGIGLAVSKKIVQEHGGLIAVQSRVGQGTTFKIMLPVQRKP